MCGDIKIEKNNIPKHDVLIGGFPCQPFSVLGKLKGFEDEERGSLFFVIKEILKEHKTKVVILENVKNIINHDNGKTFKKIIDELRLLGYVTFHHIFNSADYGVPQRRNRCYIVGFTWRVTPSLPRYLLSDCWMRISSTRRARRRSSRKGNGTSKREPSCTKRQKGRCCVVA